MEIEDRDKRLEQVPPHFRQYFSYCRTEEEWTALEKVAAEALQRVFESMETG